jgi:hypothetical protein
MSDAVQIQVATMVCALIGTIFSGVMTYLMAKLKQQQGEAAVKVAEVARKQDVAASKVAEVARKQDVATEKVAEVATKVADVAVKQDAAVAVAAAVADRQDAATAKTAEIAESLTINTAVTKATHKLVNGGHYNLLKKYARAVRRLADLHKDPNDMHEAIAAEEALARHKDELDRQHAGDRATA